MTIQRNNNNLDYLIDPAFTKFNWLFVLSFARNVPRHHRDSFSNSFLPEVEIKDFKLK